MGENVEGEAHMRCLLGSWHPGPVSASIVYRRRLRHTSSFVGVRFSPRGRLFQYYCFSRYRTVAPRIQLSHACHQDIRVADSFKLVSPDCSNSCSSSPILLHSNRPLYRSQPLTEVSNLAHHVLEPRRSSRNDACCYRYRVI